MIVLNAGLGVSLLLWSNWLEANEESLATSNIFVCLLENTSAGGNETAQGGGLSGADLVVTQSGNVAGATGTPPKRKFDGTDDYMYFSANAYNVISNGTNIWSVIVKYDTLAEAQTEDHSPLYLYNGSNSVLGYAFLSGDGKFQIWTGGVKPIDGAVPIDVPTSGTVYIAWWSDGTYVRCGWTTSGSGANGQPTKWSDFPATNRMTATTTCSWGNGTFSSASYALMRFNVQYMDGYVHYVVFSKDCLIDNAS